MSRGDGSAKRIIVRDERLAFAHRLADIADEITRSAFRAKTCAVRTKADGSAVTDVDVHVEATLTHQIATALPDDAFVGEEVGRTTRRDSHRTWTVDGIDGTGALIQGGSTWGTLIALRQDGEVQVGIASSPGLQRRWWGGRRLDTGTAVFFQTGSYITWHSIAWSRWHQPP